MQQLIVEKVWEREFDLSSRRRASIFFICGLYIVAVVSSILVSIIFDQEPAYSVWQQIAAAVFVSCCAFATNWRVAELWSAHCIVAAMFLLFFATSLNHKGIDTPIAMLLPLIPAIAAVLLGVTASAVYLVCVLAALLMLLFVSPDLSLHSAGTIETSRSLMLAFGAILVTTATAYVVSLNDRLIRALKSKGGYDEVTNLPNRYFVRDWLNRLFDAEKGSGKPIAVLCIGIDNFAEINEKRGNQRGDETMSHAAHALQKAITNNSSVIVRNRGNSFIAAIGGANSEQAHRAAEKAQQAVAALKISGVATQYMSVSVGIVNAVIDNTEKSAFGLIELAVVQLHQAQALGVAQISVAEEAAQK